MEPDWEELAFAKLTGKYKHYCLEYDGLAIDESCMEFAHCLCFTQDERNDPTFRTIRNDDATTTTDSH